jgi:hypothetical protein
MRKITSRQRGSKIVRVVDPFRRRVIQVESGLEYEHALLQIARSDVREIREQQRPTCIAASRAGRYFVDLLTILTDGFRVAYEVKYAADVKDETKQRLRIICDEVGDRFADAFSIVTEEHISEVAIENAKLIVDCGADADLDAQDAVRAAVAPLAGDVINARRIGVATGLGVRGERAAFALVQSGLLRLGKDCRLDRNAALTIRMDSRVA